MNYENLPAKAISYLFHPMLLPMLGLFLIFNLSSSGLWLPPAEIQLYVFALTFTATFLFPLANVFFLLKTKQISSLEMQTKEERRVPYLIAAIFYSAESYVLMKWEVSPLVNALMFGAMLVVMSVLIVNFFWKISAHMAGIGGLCGMMIALSGRLQININFILITLFLIAGLLGFARLKLNAHSSAQVYVGFLLGLVIQLLLFL